MTVKAEAHHLPLADRDIHVFVLGEIGSKVGFVLLDTQLCGQGYS